VDKPGGHACPRLLAENPFLWFILNTVHAWAGDCTPSLIPVL
jgi:hypothetical protein